jgi:predicted CoA-substrate-specific enzyme activase
MITAGVDMGSLTSKAVILQDGEVRSSSLVLTGPEGRAAGERALAIALERAGMGRDLLECTVATGYGRVFLPFADANVTEISCHARGAHWYFPGVRTILDMGGQDCKAIRCDESGNVAEFAMNDKCAAGVGRFVEVIAELLEVGLADVGPLSLSTVGTQTSISSTCVLFAKSEVLALLRRGARTSDILGGVCEALAGRVHGLLAKVGIEPELVISGGIARNAGVVRRIAEKTGLEPGIPPDPQLVGALGAAILAQERLRGQDGPKEP